MSTAVDSSSGLPTASRPAWRRVAPVDTTSAITSATPSRIAFSTAPSRRITEALIPKSSRWRWTTPGYAVAMRRPARSAGVALPTSPGRPAKRNVAPPKSRSRISSAPLRESTSRSRPVMPRSRSPEPTYVAMSRGRR